jgi:proteic killer suppression protein
MQHVRPLRNKPIITLGNNTVSRYYPFMIKSFRCRETERLFLRQGSSRFSADVHRLALRKLFLLDAAERLGDLRIPPGNRLEKLTGNRQGQYSIRINDQWRICFRWSEGDAYEVEIADYH